MMDDSSGSSTSGSLTVESEQDFNVCLDGGLLGPSEIVRP